MEIEDSSLYRDVIDIINSPAKDIHFSWSIVFTAGDVSTTPLKLVKVDRVRDFVNNFTDITLVTCQVLGGDYIKKILPYQDVLEATLIKTPLPEVGSGDTDSAPQSEIYRATFKDIGNPIIAAQGPGLLDDIALDLLPPIEIVFQLIDKAIEQLRFIPIGGTYRKCTNEDVLKTVMTNASASIKVDDSKKILGVDIVPTSNKQVREHVVIPQGLYLTDLPNHLQIRCGGVYSAGMGFYLQNSRWYIYPCYDVNRYMDAPKKMTIINIPKNKFPDIERTYNTDGSNIMILATGDANFDDKSNQLRDNIGNGVRFADANNFMDGFATVKDNKAVVARGKNNSEFVSSQAPSGFNNVAMAGQKITANPFEQYSQLALREGSTFSFVWHNSDVSLITPGMMAKLLYIDGDVVKEIHGSLLHVHESVDMQGVGITNERHIQSAVVTLFVQRNSN